MARRPKKTPKARGYHAGNINPALVYHQFQKKNPSPWGYETRADYMAMTTPELRKVARQLAKQSNQRLVRLEQQGLTNSYQYQTTMSYLSGAHESPEAQNRGYSTIATRTGKRFKESVNNLDRSELLYLIQNASFHLNRASTVGSIRTAYKNKLDALRSSVEFALMKEIKGYRYGMTEEIITDEELIQRIESAEYKELNKHMGSSSKAMSKVFREKIKEEDLLLQKITHEITEDYQIDWI